ncbi:MAG: bifunctional diaminohydroxyphosphoribosylaminopyrimidine deaminase/5-amino-6-(5-phosphoribosylamino)uracil reductase RibD [Acholeplasma sp.]
MEKTLKNKYMKQAFNLAKKGEGFVNPNPLVGAVIVKDGRVIGKGYHKAYGMVHAEVDAINNATEDVAGSTMFVTLEPCTHFGKQPPCAHMLVEKKIKSVYIANLDPNPIVYKQGVQILENAGIKVEYGLLDTLGASLNDIFFHYITTKRPFVAMKYAMTLDGKLATKDYDSKWITNEKSRKYVHDLRNKYRAILAGVNTIIKDDAKLNVRRHKKSRNPIRIILDPKLETPKDAYVVKTAIEQPTWIVTQKYDQAFVDLGVRLIQMDQIDLNKLLDILGDEKIDSLFVEGGAFTHAAFLEAGLVNKVYAFIGPKIIGGKHALTPVSGEGIALMKDALQLKDIKIKTFDEDILITGYIK